MNPTHRAATKHAAITARSTRTILILAAAWSLAGCPSTAGEGTRSADIALQIGAGNLSMNVGESLQVHAAVSTGTARLYTLKYESSDPAIAGVSADGVISAVAGGAATVSVLATLLDTGGSASATVQVTVAGMASSPPGTWTLCAQEHERCNFSGTHDVKYGIDNQTITKTFTDGVLCDNSVFSDPAVGRGKACWYAATGASSGGGSGVRTLLAGSDADFPNPERGFYFTAKDSEMVASRLKSFAAYYNTSLVHYHIELDAYRSAVLPQSFLDALNARFAEVRAAGLKLVVLPAYNQDASGADAPLALVLQHIDQLKPVFVANADIIPFMRGGFIGAWGEWHTSQNGLATDAAKLAIRDALLASVPSTTQINIRHPSDFQTWYPNAPATAAANRIAFSNDCFLANDTDAYTFPDGLADPLRTYAKQMTENASFGGETCDNSEPGHGPARTSCADILGEGAAYHLTWLNVSYSPIFIDRWKSDGCFAQVSAKMGYRIQLDSVSAPASASLGSSASVNVDLRNVGWSRLFSARKLVVTLRHKTSGATVEARSAGDLRALSSQATSSTTITVTVPIPADAKVGDYEVLLSLPDAAPTLAGDSRYAVRFANSDTAAKSQSWDATSGRFLTGAVVSVQ